MIHALKTEIEKLNGRMRSVGGVDGNYCRSDVNQGDITAIYSDIDNLNQTIDHLRKENHKLKQTLKGVNVSNIPEDIRGSEADQRGIRELRDKIFKLESNLQLAEENRPGEIAIRGWERARVIELEGEQQRLVKKVHGLEEECRNYKREIEAITGAKLKLAERLNLLSQDHERLKTKGLEMLKRNGYLENQTNVSQSEKQRYVEKTKTLQAQHEEEIQRLKNSLNLVNEKLYLMKQDSKDRKTFLEFDNLHKAEVKDLTNRIRSLEDTVATLRDENNQMEEKLYEQHGIIKELSKSNEDLELDREKLEVMTGEFTSLREEHNLTTQERDEATDEIRTLQRDIQDLQIKFEALDRLYVETKERNDHLDSEVERLESELEKSQGVVNTQKKDSDALYHEKRVQERAAEL